MAMDNAASHSKNKNGFDGNLLVEDAKELAEFCRSNQVHELSQALTEVLSLMVRYNEKQVPEIQETAIYNSLLRLEKAANNTSSWELYGGDQEGPLFDLTHFEINMIEQHISTYIAELLSENTVEVLFFPLSDFHASNIVVKWRILEKIATIKLFSQATVYKHKLKLHITERLKDEVSSWLNKEIERLKLSGSSIVLRDIDILINIVRKLQSQINMAMDVTLAEVLFQEAQCNYSETLSDTIDEILFPLCEQIMDFMNGYQVMHKDFHMNLRDSCCLSHALYLQLKKLSNLLTSLFKTEGRHLKLENVNSIFSKFFINLLQVIKVECHNRITRAIQAEVKDDIHEEENILSSSVIVLNCICTVIDEWKRLEIDDEEQKIAFLVKITDIVCDGVKIFAESLECRLQSVKTQTKDIGSLKKVCILANSVEHVREYLQELPQQMQWENVLADDTGDLSDPSLTEQVFRILNLIHESMNKDATEIVTRMLNVAVAGMYDNVGKLLTTWLQSQMPHQVNQSFEKFLFHLCEILDSLEDILKVNLFPSLLSFVWTYFLQSTENKFQEGLPPEYAVTVKENVMHLREYLLHANLTETDKHKALLQKLVDLMDLNSKTTEELQLDYYLQIAETIVSPIEYLGHIAFQAGYKTSGNDFVDLYICVQKGQRLPARRQEMSVLTVKLELCPNTLFPSYAPLKTSPVTEDLDNPEFNECFEFSKLPKDVLNVKGAAIQVLVYNEDYSYSAEAILLLKQVQNMSGVISLDFLPVYLMPLRKFDMSHITYHVLECRSRWDKNAKTFINKRGKLSKNQKKFLTCISGKNMICSFSRKD